MYSGGRNLGSTVDGKALLVSDVRKLEDALIVSVCSSVWLFLRLPSAKKCHLPREGSIVMVT